MLKINIELIKLENANVTTMPIGFQIFEILRKMKNFKIFLKICIFILFFFIFSEPHFSMERHSTSPRAETWLTVYRTIAIRKQWLSQPDLGPHKMVIHHPKMIELDRFCSMKYIKSQRKCCRAHVED